MQKTSFPWCLEAKPGVRMEFLDGINRIYGMEKGERYFLERQGESLFPIGPSDRGDPWLGS
jgi:hypothetical protein